MNIEELFYLEGNMIPQEQKEFVKHAFEKLKERGWFPGEEFRPSTITEEEIAAFEEQHQVKLPTLYKAYLTSMLLQTAQKSLETLINKLFSNIENVRKMAFYNKITTILLDMRKKSRGG